MDYNGLKSKWIEEEKASFEGWDFSRIDDSLTEEDLPWDYRSIIIEFLSEEDELLDMGTGGGEFLLTLEHPYELTSVTEGYEPNVDYCKKKLEPLGITVEQVFDDYSLPYEDDSFDVVINRHESYSPEEVYRVLKPGGLFITQQVGGKNNMNLSQYLLGDVISEYIDLNLENAVSELQEHHFQIIYSNEYYPYLRFYNIGSLVYFAKIISWEFPNFSVERCFEPLCKLHEHIINNGYVESKEHRFVVVARVKK